MKKLADVIKVPPHRLYQILAGKRKVTADTALHFSRYFGMSADFWMNRKGVTRKTLKGDFGEVVRESWIEFRADPWFIAEIWRPFLPLFEISDSVACALAQKACRDGYSALYTRAVCCSAISPLRAPTVVCAVCWCA